MHREILRLVPWFRPILLLVGEVTLSFLLLVREVREKGRRVFQVDVSGCALNSACHNGGADGQLQRRGERNAEMKFSLMCWVRCCINKAGYSIV